MSELAKLIATRRILKHERLELRTRLGEMHSAYLNDGERTAPEVRTSLKARILRVELELNRLETEIDMAKAGVARLRAKTLLNHITELLRERGMVDLFDEAKRRLDAQAQAIESEGSRQGWADAEQQDAELRAEIEQRLSQPLPEPA